MLEFDEQIARQVEATYMTPDVVEQRRAVRALLRLSRGERVLDIGSGPGFLVAEMAGEVGPEGRVAGVDPSESMRAVAARRDLPPGAAPVEHLPGDALSLPFEDGGFDVVVTTQVFEYVEDIPAALAEARRVLRPGGRLLVLDTDWDTAIWFTRDLERNRRVLAAWAEHLADPYLPRRLGRELRDAGFEITERVVLPILNAGWNDNTLSAGVIPLIASFVPGRAGVDEAEAEAWAQELRDLGEDYFFSINRYVFVGIAPA